MQITTATKTSSCLNWSLEMQPGADGEGGWCEDVEELIK
jgi:hypothetical protein